MLCAIFFDRKSSCLWDNVEKTWYSKTGHRWYLRTFAFLCWITGTLYNML